jgi:hypothetical protein
MLKGLLAFLTLILSASSPCEINYQSSFGYCPSRTAGSLTLSLVRLFEQKRSLKALKEAIENEKLLEKHYLSGYRINFDPFEGLLKIIFECPRPLMKVQIYKNNGIDSYEAILVENAQLFGPGYLTLLKEEKKIRRDLPNLALPVGNFDLGTRQSIAVLMKEFDEDFKKYLSELILNESNELTIILSIGERPSSVFFGNEQWAEKVPKLQKIVRFMLQKKRLPSVINLTNSKKIVVKFGDKS